MTKEPPIPAVPPAAEYNKLVSGAQILAVHLVETRAKLGLGLPTATVKGCDLTVTVESKHRAQYIEEDSVLYCGVQLNVSLMQADSEKQVATVFAEYALFYRLTENCTEDTGRAFASRNAVFNAWPFFREHVHSLCSKMGAFHVTLPLMKPS